MLLSQRLIAQRLIAVSLFAAMAVLPAYAQTTIERTTPGTSTSTTQDSTTRDGKTPIQALPVQRRSGEDGDVSIEESAILPSAGGHEASRAPSMDLDCEKHSEDCIEPLTTDSPGPTLSTPAAR